MQRQEGAGQSKNQKAMSVLRGKNVAGGGSNVDPIVQLVGHFRKDKGVLATSRHDSVPSQSLIFFGLFLFYLFGS